MWYAKLGMLTLVAASSADWRDVSRRFDTRFKILGERLPVGVRHDQVVGRIRDDDDPDAVATLLIASDGLQMLWLLEPAIGLQGSRRWNAVARLMRESVADFTGWASVRGSR